jgi:hypothetical protein
MAPNVVIPFVASKQYQYGNILDATTVLTLMTVKEYGFWCLRNTQSIGRGTWFKDATASGFTVSG